MSTKNTHSNQADSKEKVETKRINAEINKLHVEARRAELDSKRTERELNRPWYQSKWFVQAIVAGLVAIPLIWFYVKEVAIPLINRENVKLSWEVEKSKRDLEKQKQEYEEQLNELTEEKERQSRLTLAELTELRGE